VTINFNSSVDTIELIKSVLNSDYNKENLTVNLVDNCSEIPDYKSLIEALGLLDINLNIFESDHDTIKESEPYKLKVYDSKIELKKKGEFNSGLLTINLIRTIRNEGFAAANNIAAKLFSDDDYVLVINNDMVLSETSITELVRCTNKNNIITGPVLYYNTNKIWYGGGVDRFEPRLVGRHKNKNTEYDDLNKSEISKTNFVSGAYFLMPRKFITQHGLFHEAFFFGEEDAELTKRIFLAGYDIIINNSAVAWHKVGVSRNKRKSSWLQAVHWHSKCYWAKLTKSRLEYSIWLSLFFAYCLGKDVLTSIQQQKILLDNIFLLREAVYESRKLNDDCKHRRSNCYVIKQDQRY
jgi:GT2 family glycosyltransferase